MSLDLDRCAEVACELADLAGAVLRRHFRTPLAVEDKADRSPVSRADREAERAMRAHLARVLPDHAVVGEEFGGAFADDRPVWVLDPLDGTRAFLTGRPTFGIALALLKGGRPVLGLVDQPVTGDRWIAVRGRGCRFRGAPARTRPCPGLAAAVASTTSPEMFLGTSREALYHALRRRVRFFVYGGDCIGYALLAAGFADLVVERELAPHDFLPLVPLVEEAGGVVTDLAGDPLGPTSAGEVVAAGDARVHAEVLALARTTLRPAG